MVELYSAIWLSVRIASMATMLAAGIAIPVAFFLTRHRFFGKTLIETLLTVPLVLPPTVVGYGLIVVLGSRGVIGQLIQNLFGSGLIFSIGGAVLASAVVALPLLYLPAKAAFAGVEAELEDVARLMGANPLQIFWHVSLPMARRGIGSGLLLAFARALGEFGATVMVFGNLEGRKTLPILVYDLAYQSGGSARAMPAVMVLTAISLMVIFLYNRSPFQSRD